MEQATAGSRRPQGAGDRRERSDVASNERRPQGAATAGSVWLVHGFEPRRLEYCFCIIWFRKPAALLCCTAVVPPRSSSIAGCTAPASARSSCRVTRSASSHSALAARWRH